MAGASAWRVNDVVLYDLLQAEAADLTSALLRDASGDASVAAACRREVAELRRDISAVDPFDRSSVAAIVSRVGQRRRELDGGTL